MALVHVFVPLANMYGIPACAAVSSGLSRSWELKNCLAVFMEAVFMETLNLTGST